MCRKRLRATPFLALSILAPGAGLLASGPTGEEAFAAEASAEGPAEGSGATQAVKLIKAGSREFIELAPGLATARDVGSPGREGVVAVSSTMANTLTVWENFNLEGWTYTYDEYIYGLEGVLTLETKEGVFEVGPGDAIWLPEGTVADIRAGEKATTLVAFYPADWRPADGAGSEGRAERARAPAAVKLIKAETREFVERAPGLKTARDVGAAGTEGVVAVSTTLACTVAEWENLDIKDWTMLYDEYIYGLEGVLTLETKDGSFDVGPGDAIWLPEGTVASYRAEKAKTVVVVYPVNWRDKQVAD